MGSILPVAAIIGAVQSALATGEISMWPAELLDRTLPRVCVKTGKPTARFLPLRFVTTPSRTETVLAFFLGPVLTPGSVRARLPFAAGPATTLTALLLARACTSLITVASLLTAIYVPGSPRTALLVTTAISGAVGYSVYLLYFLECQFGEVQHVGNGVRWVRLRRVHPNFVSAVEAWRVVRDAAAQNPSVYSADLRWRWDGAQWVSTSLPGPGPTVRSPRPVAAWQAVPVMVLFVVILGTVAWLRFHT